MLLPVLNYRLPRACGVPKAPPLKTQGIKTKLVPFILASIRWGGAGRWVEPFLGSGVVALNAAPPRALLADTNEHLIRLYQAIQALELTADRLEDFLEAEGRALRQKGETHYYDVRTRFNQQKSPYDFVFLNRSCFNGIMRFNGKGGFNVPFCQKRDRFRGPYITKICNQVRWASAVMRGKRWTFVTQDWRATLAGLSLTDFVYVDPPYVGRHADYYNRWTAEDATELARALKSIRGPFAYSMWKENKYRSNGHLKDEFADYQVLTFDHFYHVGSKESLRNAMQEALVVSPSAVVAERWVKPKKVSQSLSF